MYLMRVRAVDLMCSVEAPRDDLEPCAATTSMSRSRSLASRMITDVLDSVAELCTRQVVQSSDLLIEVARVSSMCTTGKRSFHAICQNLHENRVIVRLD